MIGDASVTIVLVRHGEVEGIAPERFRGRTDVPLTANGEQQAAAAAKAIASQYRPSAIYTSPLRRCIVTGAAIARACAVAPKVLDTLNDIAYGTWQWKTTEEMRERAPELLERWYAAPQLVRFPGGESLQDVALRAGDAIRFALEHHRGDTIVYVTHDTLIRVMLLQFFQIALDGFWRFKPKPAGISEIRLAEAGATVLRLNE
jgi:probable phosphoglycerate mutase